MTDNRQRERELEVLLNETVQRLAAEKAADILLSELKRVREINAQSEIDRMLSNNQVIPQRSKEEILNLLKELCKLGIPPQQAFAMISSGMDLSALNRLNQSHSNPFPATQSRYISPTPSQWDTIPVGHQTISQPVTQHSNHSPAVQPQPVPVSPPSTTNLLPSEDPIEEEAIQRGWSLVIGVLIGCIAFALLANIGGFNAILNYFDSHKLTFPKNRPESKPPPNNKQLAKAPKKGDKIGDFSVTSGFGWRVHPVLGYRRFHRGVDVALPMGYYYRMPGLKGTQGKVECGFDSESGVIALVKSNDPRYKNKQIILCHLQDDSCIPGTHIAGALIGQAGSTGVSTGPHLHLGVKLNNQHIPPSRTIIEEILNVKA